VSEVWDLLSDPARASEWADDVIEVTGGPARIEKGSTYRVTSRGPFGLKATTPFTVEQLEDMRELKMQCQVTGFFTHWVLTEAQGGTSLHTKSFLRSTVEKTLDGLRRAVGRFPAP
jgi:hypothetical protein